MTSAFPIPHSDASNATIDLNELFLIKKLSCFLFRMSSDAMTGVGILQDDLMVVDKSIPPQHLHIVLAVVDGEFFVRRLFKKGRVVRLTPENEKYQTIELVDGQELFIWGVVTACLRRLT